MIRTSISFCAAFRAIPRTILLVTILLTFGHPLSADDVIDLTTISDLPPGDRAMLLHGNGSWFIDERGTLSLEEAMTLAFDETPRVDFGITDAVVWSRFRLVSGKDSSWILFSRPHKVDRIDFYAVYPDGRMETASAGTEIPVEDRAYRYRRPAFPFAVNGGEPVEIFVRMRARSSLYRDFTLSGDSFFLNYVLRDECFLFFYFGAIIVIAAYNLVIFFMTRDRNYLYYFLYVIFMLMYQVSAEGYGSTYLWPRWPWFMPRSYNIFIAAAFAVSVLFTRSYLDLGKNAPGLDIVGKILILIFSAVGIGFLFTTAGWLVSAGTVCILTGVIYFLTSAYHVLRMRYQPAAYFAVAWTVLMTGLLVTTFKRVHWIPHTILTEYALHIGNLVEVVLLALALGDRVRFHQQKRLEAEEALVDANARVLQNRMKPHFLFNSMNIIFSQLRDDPKRAQETLGLLSDNYHYLSDTDGRSLVTLKEEWEFLVNYLELMKRRWPGETGITCRFDESLSRLPVPPVILQPLAENAFKYGLRETTRKELVASCAVEEGVVSLRITNPAARPLGQVSYARSLGNIRDRLRRYYNEADLLLYQRGQNIVAEIRFPFPGAGAERKTERRPGERPGVKHGERPIVKHGGDDSGKEERGA